MKHSQNGPKSDTLWQKTQYANLVRYVPSGQYFARIRVQGKLIRKTLATDVISVAVLRLGDLEKTLRERSASEESVESGKMTFEDLLGVYRQRLAANPDVKPSTKHYRGEAIIAVLKTWPELPKLDVRKISERMLKDWAVRFRAKYSSSRFNGTVDTLRAILNTAVEEGVLYRNPINAVDRASVRTSKPELPDSETFLRFVREIAKGLGRDSKKCADLVEFLAYGGFRIGEAKFVAWADCDMAKGKIVVRGHPETGTKNGEDREVPMIPDMKALLERLRSERPNQPPGAPVMEVKECLMAMRRAAAAIGMKRITHHDLRHLFATKCIESGVDIPTVSRWLGHKDGGALAMRVYGHLRDQHSVSMAQKVSFAKVDLKNVVQLPIQEAV